MQIQKVLVHSCFQKGKGTEKDTPLSPHKCRCRQRISVSEAAAFVASGLAQYVVVSEKIVRTEEACPTCSGDENLRKFCTGCNKTGNVTVQNVYQVRGEDIIFISLDGKKNTKTTQVKKSPTIEKAHIERAYINNNVHEQARIEIYGTMYKEFLHSLIVGPEPPDDLKAGTGRRYDYGRNV